MNGWKRSGRGGRLRLVTTLDAQEVAGAARARRRGPPHARLAGGRATPRRAGGAHRACRPARRRDRTTRVLARLLPDFATDDADLSGGLRSLHEPELIAAKDAAAAVVLDTLPGAGGRVELTPDQADAWLAALNDVRLALGTALDVSEDMPDDLPADDPRAGHLGVYHWLTYVQDGLVQSRMALR